MPSRISSPYSLICSLVIRCGRGYLIYRTYIGKFSYARLRLCFDCVNWGVIERGSGRRYSFYEPLVLTDRR